MFLGPSTATAPKMGNFYGSLFDAFLNHLEGNYKMAVKETCTNVNCPEPQREKSRKTFAVR